MTSSWVQFPLIYYLDVRVWVSKLSRELGRTITLSEVRMRSSKSGVSHFDAIWLMGVWQTGEESRTLALNNPSHSGEWADILPIGSRTMLLHLHIQLQVPRLRHLGRCLAQRRR